MPAFNYSTGNPANLVAGTSANMADIQGPFTDLKTALNGGLDETNVPNLTAAFTTYERLHRCTAQIGVVGAATYLMAAQLLAPNVVAGNANATVGTMVLYLDPVAFNANSRTTKLRIYLTATPNSVAPTITYTCGLYPIATYGGGASSGPIIATIGTVVSGSTVPIAAPGAAALTPATGADFNFPAAGAYVLGVATSGTPAASNVTDLTAYLEMRRV